MGKRNDILRWIFLSLLAALFLTGCGGNSQHGLFTGPTATAYITVPTPFQYDFGAVLVESVNEKTFTVMNEGNRDASSLTGIFTISAFGYKGGSFPGAGGTCQSNLPAHSSCTIVVVFNPQYADVFTEYINLNYFNGERTDLATTVQLLGRGVASAAGTLDTTFHGSGLATLTVGSGPTEAKQILSLPDKSLLVAGEAKDQGQWDMYVLKLTPNGDIDSSFGTSGVAVMDFAGGDDFVASLLILLDGRIMVAGRAFASGKFQFAFWRLTPTGVNDSSFGISGKMTVSVGDSDSEIRAIAQQSDSSLVAAGSAYTGAKLNFAAVRLLPNASLDGSFGTGGKAILPIGTEDDRATGLTLLGDGKMILGGYTDNGANLDMVALKLLANGSPDTAWGSAGKCVVDFSGKDDEANVLATQYDGKILLAGKSGTPSEFAITRINTNGTIDSAFGTNGRISTAMSTDPASVLAIAIQSDGRIVAAGYSSSGSDQDVTMARYAMSGTLDSTFGTGGRAYFPVGSTADRANGLFLAANNKILLVGDTGSPDTQGVIGRVWP